MDRVYEWLRRLRLLLAVLLRYQVAVCAHWEFECYDSQGNLRWRDGFKNLVVTEGLNTLISNTFKTIPSSVSWYVGLKGSGTPAAGDTMASHASWSEITPYSNATRPAFTPGTVANGAVDNDAAKAQFSINATSTVYGGFVSDNSTKGGTTGKLYGAGDFAAQRDVQTGDTLNVKVTLSAAAA